MKWQSDYPDVKVGEPILLRGHTVRQGSWFLGRTEHLYTGRDGIVQFFNVRTKTDDQ